MTTIDDTTSHQQSTTMTNVFESNNLAVVYLMNGNLEQAHCLFHDAFEEATMHIRALAEEELSPCDLSKQDGNPASTPATWSTQVQRKPFLPRDFLLDTLDRACSNGDDPRNHALMITVPEEDDDTVSNHPHRHDKGIDWSLVSPFVVYNLGILYMTSAPPSLEPNRGRRNDHQHQFLSRANLIFASAKALLLKATRTSTLALTGNPLIDLLSLLTLFKLAETTTDLEGESELQKACCNELLDLVSRLEAALCCSTLYNDPEVERLLRTACQLLTLQCTMLRQRCPSSSAPAA